MLFPLEKAMKGFYQGMGGRWSDGKHGVPIVKKAVASLCRQLGFRGGSGGYLFLCSPSLMFPAPEF